MPPPRGVQAEAEAGTAEALSTLDDGWEMDGQAGDDGGRRARASKPVQCGGGRDRGTVRKGLIGASWTSQLMCRLCAYGQYCLCGSLNTTHGGSSGLQQKAAWTASA